MFSCMYASHYDVIVLMQPNFNIVVYECYMSYLFDDGFIVFDNSHDQINQHIENSLPQDSTHY